MSGRKVEKDAALQPGQTEAALVHLFCRGACRRGNVANMIDYTIVCHLLDYYLQICLNKGTISVQRLAVHV